MEARKGTMETAGGSQDHGARLRLLEAAMKIFNDKGYAAATVNEIVEAAGVTKPVLYYYFHNKEGIFLELMNGATKKFHAIVGVGSSATGSVEERIRRLIRELLELFEDNIQLVRIMYGVYYGPPQGAPKVDFSAFHDHFRSVLRSLVEEGIRRREFRRGDPMDMTWAIIGPLSGCMEVTLCHPEVCMGPDKLDRVLDIVFRGMKPSSTTA